MVVYGKLNCLIGMPTDADHKRYQRQEVKPGPIKPIMQSQDLTAGLAPNHKYNILWRCYELDWSGSDG